MRTELSRCERDLPARLARRLSLPTSSLAPIKRWALSTEHWAVSSLQLSQHLFVTNTRRQNWNLDSPYIAYGHGNLNPMWIKLKFRYWKMFKLIYPRLFRDEPELMFTLELEEKDSWQANLAWWRSRMAGDCSWWISSIIVRWAPGFKQLTCKVFTALFLTVKLKKGIRLDVIFLSEDSECCFVELLKDFITNKL